MWVSTHALSGAALASTLPGGVAVAAPAAVALHALLDVVPHWDYTAARRPQLWAAADLAASAGILGLLARGGASRALLAGAILSAAPDLDSLHVVLPGTGRRTWFPSHRRGFPHGACRPACGVALQAVVGLAAAGVLLKRR